MDTESYVGIRVKVLPAWGVGEGYELVAAVRHSRLEPIRLSHISRRIEVVRYAKKDREVLRNFGGAISRSLTHFINLEEAELPTDIDLVYLGGKKDLFMDAGLGLYLIRNGSVAASYKNKDIKISERRRYWRYSGMPRIEDMLRSNI